MRTWPLSRLAIDALRLETAPGTVGIVTDLLGADTAVLSPRRVSTSKRSVAPGVRFSSTTLVADPPTVVLAPPWGRTRWLSAPDEAASHVTRAVPSASASALTLPAADAWAGGGGVGGGVGGGGGAGGGGVDGGRGGG